MADSLKSDTLTEAMTDDESQDTAAADTASGESVDLDLEHAAESRGGMGLVAGVAAAVILIDQITKIWAVSELTDRTIDLFWTARLHLIYNYGSAFGLGSSLGRWLGVLILFVVAAVLAYARSVTSRAMLIMFGAIAGGAIGNLIDRVARAEDGFMSGGVVDFIDFQWWPVFNVADIAIVCGGLGLMALSFREAE